MLQKKESDRGYLVEPGRFEKAMNLYHEKMFAKTREYFKGKNVLDVGCGVGEFSAMLAKNGFNVTAVDLESHESWKKLESKNLCFQKADASKLPFNENSFDIVFSNGLLHHMRSPEKAVREMARVAKNSAIIFEANRFNPISYLFAVKISGHNHFSQNRFRQLVSKSAAPNKASFLCFENRFYPTNSYMLLKMFFWLQGIADRIPFFYPILSFNVGVIEKSG